MKRQLLTLFCALFMLGLAAQPQPCQEPAAMTSTCLDACVICDIDGFTGTNNLTVQGQTFPGFCTTMFHNMSYIAFIAGSEDLTIEVSVSNCQINWGLEIGFFESPDCETFIPVTDCNTDVAPNSTATFSNDEPLTIGQHYYLIMDGSAGDICDWTFNVLYGTTLVSPLSTTGEIEGNNNTCADFPGSYTAGSTAGATIFYWTVDGVLQNATAQTIELTFPGDGTYELCVSAANACDLATPSCTTVEVHTPESLVLIETLCDNDCLEVAGETLCDPGEYEFHITLPNGCDSAIFVTLDILPQSQSFVDINLCAGESFYIGPTPYNSSGIYTDTIPTILDCDSIVTLDLFIIECEIIASTDFVQPVCSGAADGFLVFSVENGTPPFSYLWEHLTIAGIGGTGSTTLFDNNMISGVPAGVYEINISDNFDNDVVVFQEVIDPPLLTLELEALAINGYNLSCAGGADGMITAIPGGGISDYTYLWENTSTTNSIQDLEAGIYSCSLTDANGCEVINMIELIAPPPIAFHASFTAPDCDGLNTGMIVLDSVWGGSPPYQYSLDMDSFDLLGMYQGLLPGTYTFSIVDNHNCLADTTAFLDTPDIPQIFFQQGLSVDLGCFVDIPTLTNNTDLATIIWTPDYAMDCDTCLRPTVGPYQQTTYTLSLSSVDGCTTTDSISVDVVKVRDVYFPNAFSPNGDGINDYFFIGTGKSVAQINYLKIFDRWGEQVYDGYDLPLEDPRSGWDGYFNGDLLSSGVFIWMAEIRYLDGLALRYAGDISIVK